MPTKTITVCASCGKKTCDGGIWKIVRIVSIKTGQDESWHPENTYGCTLSWFRKGGQYNKLAGVPVGTITTKRFTNWSDPADVTLVKVEM